MNPLEGSKTFRLVLISMGFIVLLVLIGAVVQILFQQNIWQGILGAAGLNTLQVGGGIARNIITDAPVRQAMAQQQPMPPLPPPNVVS